MKVRNAGKYVRFDENITLLIVMMLVVDTQLLAF